jgi:hypothetical protein
MALPKLPQHGDAAKIEQLASGLKNTGGTHGPVVQRTPAGRPQGTGGTPAPRASQQQQEFQVPQDHLDVFENLAWVTRTRAELEQSAMAPDAGPYTRFYALLAQRLHDASTETTVQTTPFFE